MSMNEVFAAVVRLSLQGAVLTALILLARLPLKRCAARWRHVLWLLLIVRLLVPFSLPSPASLYNLLPAQGPLPDTIAPMLSPAAAQNAAATFAPGASSAPAPAPAVPPGSTLPHSSPQHVEPAQPLPEPTAPPFSPLRILPQIWLAGSGIMLLYMGGVYAHAYRRARKRRDGQGIAVLRGTRPYVIGLVRPTIVLPPGLSEGAYQSVLIHERTHIRRGDHIVHLLMTLAVCLHWFNPAVWIARHMMDIDCEAACDELATRDMSALARKQYAAALLEVASGDMPRALPVLAFSGGGLRARIQGVLRTRRYTAVSAIAGVVVLITVAAVALTGALPKSAPSANEPLLYTDTPTAAASTPAPTQASALPLGDMGDLSLLTWDQSMPSLPALSAWTYRKEKNESLRDLTAIAQRLWPGEQLDAFENDQYRSLGLPKPSKGKKGGQISLSTITQSPPHDVFSYNLAWDGILREQNTPVEQAQLEAEALIELATGDSRYTQYPEPVQSVPEDVPLEYDFRWYQRRDGLRLEDSIVYARHNSAGVSDFSIEWPELTAVDTAPSSTPLTFEEALYALNYYRVHRENAWPFTRISAAEPVYTTSFHPQEGLYAPAWAFELAEDLGDGQYSYYSVLIDALTGESFEYLGWYGPSPYPSRGSTPGAQAFFTQQEAFRQEYEALFPLVFARQDGYAYSLAPIESEDYWKRMGIWRRNEQSGVEVLLDDGAASYLDGSSIREIRNSMFAALVENRIVFLGYEDMLDMKSGGSFTSIALDGSDRRTLHPKLNALYNLCADGERIYYQGYAANDETDIPLNYVDALLTRDINVITSEKEPFAVKDGTAYALDDRKTRYMANPDPDAYAVSPLPGRVIYRLENGVWTPHEEVPFIISSVSHRIESGDWVLYGQDGEEYIFAP